MDAVIISVSKSAQKPVMLTVMEAKKTCRICDKPKPISAFYVRDTRCKECRRELSRAEYAAGTSSTRSYDGVFKASIKRLYGMTMEEYDAMLRAQAYRCAVCRRDETKKRRNGQPYRLGVDHDHVTMKPRALLCQRCNIIVWALEDNHTLIPALMAYVENFRKSLAT